MQELARGAILLPIVLRCWLKEEHLRPEIRGPLLHLSNTYFDKSKFAHSENFSAVEWIVAAVHLFAQSILRLCGPYSPGQREIINQAVLDGRRAIQFLAQASAGALRVKYGM